MMSHRPRKSTGGLIESTRGRDNQIMRRADPSMRIDPDSATSDRNVVRGNAPANPADDEQGLARGGKVKPNERTSPMDPKNSKTTPKHKEDRPAGAVPMRHLNRLGTLSQDNPQGVGKPSTDSKIGNAGRKTW